MPQKIITIRLMMPLKLGPVNCYLIKTETGFVLIDTGCSNRRTDLEKELEKAGCKPGNLKLVILTHGDFDHVGNAAYLRERFGAKIAMHYGDSGMVEHGDMFWNRKKVNFLIRMIVPVILKFIKLDRCRPDLYFEDGYDLSEYGFDARVIHIPGHSSGSIGILTASGDLFGGDLLLNGDKPKNNSIIDDPEAANASIEKLRNLEIDTVYPGHGRPFPMGLFIKNNP
jgi:hydroxyacylglutathione hydrolase